MTLTYENLAARLTGRNRESRKIGNHTYLHRRSDDTVAVRLHNTDILIYFSDGRIQFFSGGYRTVTTKERINKWAPVTLSQKNGHWSITSDNDYSKQWQDRDWISYADGMILDTKTGEWQGAAGGSEREAVEMVRKLKRYSALYMKAFDAGEVPAPSAGDCWGCALKTKDGKTAMGNSHILSHLKENYFVPSLLANAIKRFPSSQAARWYIDSKWSDEKNPLNDFARGGRIHSRPSAKNPVPISKIGNGDRGMRQYWIVKDGRRNFSVRSGLNGIIEETFTSRKAAQNFISRKYREEIQKNDPYEI